MAKNILFCADGTWNGDDNDPADSTNPSNVLKLFHNLDGVDTIDTYGLADEQERMLAGADGTPLQVAKYLHGVGDSANWLVKLIGGTLGAGLVARVVRGYTFVSRHYQPGDAIHLIGFSRGAYTARALSGLIAARGLLDSDRMDLDDRAGAYRAGAAVWSAYRRDALAGDADMLGKLEDLLGMLPGFVGCPAAAIALRSGVAVATVAVWETVGAMGIPVFDAQHANIDALRFTDAKLAGNVVRGVQAIAIDERRGNFSPCIWDADPRVTQALFPGAHSDVGGGYPLTGGESGLSDGALDWMTTMLRPCGVRFASSPAVPPQPSAMATAHDPVLHLPWRLLDKSTRVPPRAQLPGGLLLHDSVRARLAAPQVRADPTQPPAPYRPANLADYGV